MTDEQPQAEPVTELDVKIARTFADNLRVEADNARFLDRILAEREQLLARVAELEAAQEQPTPEYPSTPDPLIEALEEARKARDHRIDELTAEIDVRTRELGRTRAQRDSIASRMKTVEKRVRELQNRISDALAVVDGEASGGPIPASRDQWGPVCASCGNEEYRVDGYCSVECRDRHEWATEIRAALDPDMEEAHGGV